MQSGLLTPDGMLASDADGGSECNKSMTVTAHQLQNDSWYLADKGFCWNRCAGEMLDDITLPTNRSRRSIRALLLPLICGSFGCFRDSQGDTSLSLVARTSVSRFGIRHYCRGSNTEGEVANFVETEQIVCVQTVFVVFCHGAWLGPLECHNHCGLSWNQKSLSIVLETFQAHGDILRNWCHIMVVSVDLLRLGRRRNAEASIPPPRSLPAAIQPPKCSRAIFSLTFTKR